MRLITITEYGSATADFHKLVAGLHEQKDPPFLVATFGMADLIEISLRQGDSHHHAIQSSGVHVFRRSFGALCPEEEDFPADRTDELRAIEKLLRRNPSLPFFATTYLKLSPIPVLCFPSSTESPLTQTLLSRLFERGSSLWKNYHAVLGASLKPSPDPLPRLEVSPLIGLDSVDLVLLSRAARLEQIAALSWALRSQKLGDWKISALDEARQKAETITGLSGTSLEHSWSHSALFGSSATVVGLPIYFDDTDSIHLEDSEPDRLAARAVCLSTRLTYAPGGFQNAVSFPTIEPRTAYEGDPHNPADTEFLLLFDRFDILQLPTASLREYPHELSLKELRSYLSAHIETAQHDSTLEERSRSVRARTEIAVLTRLPADLARPEERPDLYELFHERLRIKRAHHLTREGEPSAWSQRWQSATARAGMLYPVSSGVLTLIETVLEYLEDDLEGFVELLPAIKNLIGFAERGDDFPTEKLIKEVLKLSGMLQGLATSRGRRDHPFRFPRETLAFEGHAGHRVPRAAFVAFVDSLSASLDPQSLILVLESSGGAVSCRPGLTSNIVRVSPLLFSHPIHWVFAHEVAHGSFWHTSRSTASNRPELVQLLAQEENVGKLFDRFRRDLGNGRPLLQELAAAAGLMSEEVPADLMLWDTLNVDCSDPRETDRLFWFIQGPGLVFAHRHIWGSKMLRKGVIRPLILRIFFLCRILAQDQEEDVSCQQMIEDLYLVLEDLRRPVATHTTDVEDNDRSAPRPLPERGSRESISILLHGLQEDLRLSPNEWRMAVEGLWTGVDTLLDPFPEEMEEADNFRETLSAWLSATITIRRELRPKRQPHPEAIGIWNQYRHYLRALIEMWPSSYPWLPVLPPAPGEKLPAVAIDPRGGIFFQEDRSAAEYRRLTYDLLLNLDELGRESRLRKIVEYLQE